MLEKQCLSQNLKLAKSRKLGIEGALSAKFFIKTQRYDYSFVSLT